MPFMDTVTGKTLEHIQLRRQPKYKKRGTNRIQMNWDAYSKA